MGKPGGSHVPSPPSESIGGAERTGGIEPSQYPQEKKATAIPEVAASETGTAYTGRVPSVRALHGRCRGIDSDSLARESRSYKPHR